MEILFCRSQRTISHLSCQQLKFLNEKLNIKGILNISIATRRFLFSIE